MAPPPKKVRERAAAVVVEEDQLREPLLGRGQSEEKVEALRREMQEMTRALESRVTDLSARLERAEALRKQQVYVALGGFLILFILYLTMSGGSKSI